MGTTFFVDEMFPAVDAEAREKNGGDRQVEVFRPSGQDVLCLRLGELDREHAGTGSCVELDRERALSLLEGLERAASYMGWRQ